MDNNTYIGLDVHKETIDVAIAKPGRSPGQILCSIGNGPKEISGLLNRLKRDGWQYRFCYEAGPCGYGLYRYLESQGWDCSVVAPSLIPRRSGDRIKTNRRDALQLAQLHRAGELTEVWVPDPEQEGLRDLCRTREDAVLACKKAKLNLRAFLLRHGLRYPGKRAWSKQYFKWLETVKFEFTAQQVVLQDYIDTTDRAMKRIGALEKQMAVEFEQWDWKPIGEALMALRGVDLITAMAILTEIGDLRRFDTAREFMGYLGLVPSEFSTGKKQTRGAITKTGNSHVRRLLVESAWCYRHPPRKTTHWKKRAQQSSEQVQDISWKAMLRLHQRYWRLVNRKVKTAKAITAVARELAGFVWAVAHQAYDEQLAQAA